MKIKAFTLFEVLISLVILSVVLLLISRINNENESLKVYYQLQKIENNYLETQTIQSTETIKFKTN